MPNEVIKPSMNPDPPAASQGNGRSTTVFTSNKPGPMRTVKFGDVTVTGPEPSEAAVAASIALGAEGLKRALTAMLTPGIRLDPVKDVPLYSADPETLGVYVRELNGKRDRGIVKDGVFKPIP